jgi:hypothetical protein
MDLHLNLKGIYFDQIKAGTKIFEFRAVSSWANRLDGRVYENIVLKRGYPRIGDDSRRLVRPWQGCTIEVITHPHFGNHPVLVYSIRVNPDKSPLLTATA